MPPPKAVRLCLTEGLFSNLEAAPLFTVCRGIASQGIIGLDGKAEPYHTGERQSREFARHAHAINRHLNAQPSVASDSRYSFRLFFTSLGGRILSGFQCCARCLCLECCLRSGEARYRNAER